MEFLSSIKFARHKTQDYSAPAGNRFARFDQRAPVARQFAAEDSYLVRSAN